MSKTMIPCKPCKGSGSTRPNAITVKPSEFCPKCDGYGYRNAESGRRVLKSGQQFYFLMAWENDAKTEWKAQDFVELNGGGCLVIGDAESYEPSFDRAKNFFFTMKEARAAIRKIKTVINQAK